MMRLCSKNWAAAKYGILVLLLVVCGISSKETGKQENTHKYEENNLDPDYQNEIPCKSPITGKVNTLDINKANSSEINLGNRKQLSQTDDDDGTRDESRSINENELTKGKVDKKRKSGENQCILKNGIIVKLNQNGGYRKRSIFPSLTDICQNSTCQKSLLNCSEFKRYLQSTDLPMVVTHIYAIWSQLNRHQLHCCLKQEYYRIIKGILSEKNHKEKSLKELQQLICDIHFDFTYTWICSKTILWYPFIKSNHTNETKENLLNFNRTFNNAKGSIMPTIPWACLLGQNTKQESNSMEESTVLANLWLLNKTLPMFCRQLICQPKNLLPTIVTFSVNKTQNWSICESQASTLSSPWAGNDTAFYFSLTTKKLVFTKNQGHTQNKNKTIASILIQLAVNKHFLQCCSDVSDYVLTSPINSFVDKMYFFCIGLLQSCELGNITWLVDDVTEIASLVLLNNKFSHPEHIRKSILLQKFIFSNVTLTPDLYNLTASLKIKPSRKSQCFQTSLISVSYKDVTSLEKIFKEININYTINANSIILTDEDSLWNPLNMVIIYNCTITNKNDDTALLLILSNSTNYLEYICQGNTTVFMSSIGKEHVRPNKTEDFKRGSSDGGIGDQTDDGYIEDIVKCNDYETRFYHFLLYPLDFSMKDIIEHFLSDQTYMIEYEKKFKIWNTHPNLNFGVTKIDSNKRLRPLTQIENNTGNSHQEVLQMIVLAYLVNNTQCLKDFQSGQFSMHVIDSDFQRPHYTIGPIPSDVKRAHCLSLLPTNTYKKLKASNKSKTLTINKFWTTCNYNMMFSWHKTYSKEKDWNYLTLECIMKEIMLLVVMCSLTTVTIVGNLLVLIILIRTGLAKRKSFIIHTSLAIADLLLGITAGLLSIYDAFCLIYGKLTIYDLDENGLFASFTNITSEQPLGFRQMRFRRKEYLPVISSIMMNVSISVSIWTLAIFSIERLLIMKRTILDDYHLKVSIFAVWFFSVICAILVHCRDGEWDFVGYFDPITKLTLNLGSDEWPIATYVQMFTGCIAGMIIVFVTITSLISFHRTEIHKQNTMAIHDDLRSEKVSAVVHTFLLMVGLFLTSSLPLVITQFWNLAETHPIAHFFCWWIFMAGASWNWILYCFRGKYFKEEARKAFHYHNK